MADEKKPVDKEAVKAQKEAEKKALKEKKERIKQSKPKKEGNVVSRAAAKVKKFCKDFKGTCKKVIWPDRKTVLKNTLIVFLVTIVVGVGIWIADFAFVEGIKGIQSVIENNVDEDTSTLDDSAEVVTDEHGHAAH